MNLVGIGGESPGVAAVGVGGTGEASHLLVLAEGESIYALDAAPDACEFVAGTRAGAVYLGSGNAGQSDSDAASQSALLLGVMSTPVLSVCHMGDSRIAAASTSRACGWRTGTAAGELVDLDTAGGIVCALRRLGSERLAGLTTDGRLFIWNLPDPAPSQVVACEPPPRCWGIVCLVFDTTTRALFWPVQSGALTRWQEGECAVQTFAAHSGEWYALCLSAGRLITVGRDDARLVVWDQHDGKPLTAVDAPCDTIAVSRYGVQEEGLLTISGAGMARTIGLGETEAVVHSLLPGGDYRTTQHVDGQWGQQERPVQPGELARELTTQIAAALGSGNLRDVPRLHGELQALGYAHISLALQADQARRGSDALGELRLRKQLFEMVDETEHLGPDCLLRYADLLEALWQIAAAVEMVDIARTLWPSKGESVSRGLLEAKAEALSGENVLIEPDVSFSVVAEACHVVGRSPSGRWVCQRGKPTVCREVRLTAGDIFREFQKDSTNGASTAEARLLELTVASQTAVERYELVLLPAALGTAASGWELGLEVAQRGGDSTVTALPIFQPAVVPRSQWPDTPQGQVAGRPGAGGNATVIRALGNLPRLAAEGLRRAVTKRAKPSRRTRH